MKRPTAVFRVDASLVIGAGHVMRCLTLAEALREVDWSIRFICREHPGSLIDVIGERSFPISVLPRGMTASHTDGLVTPEHPAWLGASWEEDAAQTLAVISDDRPEWLVVDHYALDVRWENVLRPRCGQLLVIDDLADRQHIGDMLLNQNLDVSPSDYQYLVSQPCCLLTGPSYALLRPGFAALRDGSLARRESGRLEHIVVSMGGVDNSDATSHVLTILAECSLPSVCRISVVLGATAPWLNRVREAAAKLSIRNNVLVNVTDMPTLLAAADLVIGAAGSSSWERCALGVPCVMLIASENQRPSGLALHARGAVDLIDGEVELANKLKLAIKRLIHAPEQLAMMVHKASEVCDGQGVPRVVASMRRIMDKE